MITSDSISAVKEAIIIEQLIADFVPALKKQGNSWKAPCPFHGEKTASFTVSPQKGFFKCFGCGEGGDGIAFIMKHERKNYPDALRLAAKRFNIQLVEEVGNKEDAAIKDTKAGMYEINAAVAHLYQQNLLQILKTQPDHWLTFELYGTRNLSDETIIDFKLGFAPDGWDFLTAKYTEAEHIVILKDLGLISQTDKGKNYDFFRNRLMFPFMDQLGRVTGFTGRKPNDGDEKNPKYFNSRDSLLFKKGSQFFGLYQAEKSIRKGVHAILVEGQFDVCQMHQSDFGNTIAASGTAFSAQQAKFLKRFTNHAIIMTDNDKAGINSTLSAIDILVEEGFKTEVVQLPDAHDPDSFIRGEQLKLEEKSMESGGR
jgi:DNA primase